MDTTYLIDDETCDLVVNLLRNDPSGTFKLNLDGKIIDIVNDTILQPHKKIIISHTEIKTHLMGNTLMQISDVILKSCASKHAAANSYRMSIVDFLERKITDRRIAKIEESLNQIHDKFTLLSDIMDLIKQNK